MRLSSDPTPLGVRSQPGAARIASSQADPVATELAATWCRKPWRRRRWQPPPLCRPEIEPDQELTQTEPLDRVAAVRQRHDSEGKRGADEGRPTLDIAGTYPRAVGSGAPTSAAETGLRTSRANRGDAILATHRAARPKPLISRAGVTHAIQEKRRLRPIAAHHQRWQRAAFGPRATQRPRWMRRAHWSSAPQPGRVAPHAGTCRRCLGRRSLRRRARLATSRERSPIPTRSQHVLPPR
jgi:hypothetical protein